MSNPSPSKYIPAGASDLMNGSDRLRTNGIFLTDDDDFDEESMPAFSQPALTPIETIDKDIENRSEMQPSPANARLSGNIRTSSPSLNNTKKTVGGLRVETR